MVGQNPAPLRPVVPSLFAAQARELHIHQSYDKNANADR